jgi:hypothetical protein
LLTSARTATREAKQVAIPRAVARPRPAVVAALARLETRKLLTSPAFLTGLGLVGAFVLLATGSAFFASEDGSGNERASVLVLGAAIGLIAATLLGANSCALRAHRDRVRELFGSLPSPPESRTAGLLLALILGPFLLVTAVLAIAYPVLRNNPDLHDHINIALLVQVPLTALALGSFGIALARWIRHPIAGPAALVVHVMTPIIWLVPWVAPASSGIHMGWHYTYLVAAIVFWASLALAGDRRQARALLVPATVLALVVVSASFQMPPGGLV